MRNMLAFLAALALTVVIAGYYLGWYHITSTPGQNGHRNVSIDINTNKIEKDLHKGTVLLEKKIDKNLGTTPTTSGVTDGAMTPETKPHRHDRTQNAPSSIPDMLREGTTLVSPF